MDRNFEKYSCLHIYILTVSIYAVKKVCSSTAYGFLAPKWKENANVDDIYKIICIFFYLNSFQWPVREKLHYARIHHRYGSRSLSETKGLMRILGTNCGEGDRKQAMSIMETERERNPHTLTTLQLIRFLRRKEVICVTTI